MSSSLLCLLCTCGFSLLLVLAGACRPAPSTPLPAQTPPLPAHAAPVAAESPRLEDPRWIQARSDDPLEKARLAVAVGAAELLAGVDDGRETGATALAALPFADDGEIALGRLAELARADAGRRRALLTAILGIAGQPRRQREPLDLEGARRCAEVLAALAADAGVPREERALAVSAARALAEQGVAGRAPVDVRGSAGASPASPRTPIPSDLDAESRYPRRP